ncbi:MAG: hypothetical protein LBE70_02575 [Nitrososphaerota archaeon]|nr:hypothetical protein [Nitrososphaerota archaeon]
MVAAAEWWYNNNQQIADKFCFTRGPLRGYMLATIVHKTDKALLLRLQRHPYETVNDLDMWIPKSAIPEIKEAQQCSKHKHKNLCL